MAKICMASIKTKWQYLSISINYKQTFKEIRQKELKEFQLQMEIITIFFLINLWVKGHLQKFIKDNFFLRIPICLTMNMLLKWCKERILKNLERKDLEI